MPTPPQLRGAKIIGADGQFLGDVNQQRFKQDSIAKPFGTYGSTSSKTSIFNRFCPYGSITSDLSAFSKRAKNPPRLVLRNGRWAYLTKNKRLKPSLDPQGVIDFARKKR